MFFDFEIKTNKTLIKPDLRLVRRLRWGWVFLERTRILSGIQFTMHFIDFPVVEAKQFEDYTPAQPRNRR